MAKDTTIAPRPAPAVKTPTDPNIGHAGKGTVVGSKPKPGPGHTPINK